MLVGLGVGEDKMGESDASAEGEIEVGRAATEEELTVRDTSVVEEPMVKIDVVTSLWVDETVDGPWVEGVMLEEILVVEEGVALEDVLVPEALFRVIEKLGLALSAFPNTAQNRCVIWDPDNSEA